MKMTWRVQRKERMRKLLNNNPIKICTEYLNIIQTVVLSLALVFLCCFRRYIRTVQFFFLLSGILQTIFYVLIRNYTKQNVMFVLIGSEIFFSLFILNQIIPEFNRNFKQYFDTFCFAMTNLSQIGFMISCFLINRQNVKKSKQITAFNMLNKTEIQRRDIF